MFSAVQAHGKNVRTLAQWGNTLNILRCQSCRFLLRHREKPDRRLTAPGMSPRPSVTKRRVPPQNMSRYGRGKFPVCNYRDSPTRPLGDKTLQASILAHPSEFRGSRGRSFRVGNERTLGMSYFI